jgi:hypothetical protein
VTKPNSTELGAEPWVVPGRGGTLQPDEASPLRVDTLLGSSTSGAAAGTAAAGVGAGGALATLAGGVTGWSGAVVVVTGVGGASNQAALV